jgi:hypothetical protein
MLKFLELAVENLLSLSFPLKLLREAIFHCMFERTLFIRQVIFRNLQNPGTNLTMLQKSPQLCSFDAALLADRSSHTQLSRRIKGRGEGKRGRRNARRLSEFSVRLLKASGVATNSQAHSLATYIFTF